MTSIEGLVETMVRLKQCLRNRKSLELGCYSMHHVALCDWKP